MDRHLRGHHIGADDPRARRIVGLLDDNDAQALSTDFIIAHSTYAKLFTERMDASVYLSLRDGVDTGAAERATAFSILQDS